MHVTRSMTVGSLIHVIKFMNVDIGVSKLVSVEHMLSIDFLVIPTNDDCINP